MEMIVVVIIMQVSKENYIDAIVRLFGV